jgi:light-harvesting complex 1 alpha chain
MPKASKTEHYKVWLMFEPRLALPAVVGGLSVLALIIHTLLLSTDRYNWLETGDSGPHGGAAVYQPVLPARDEGQ